MASKYGIPVADLPNHCLDAVDAAERSHARTLVVRDGQPIAAIVPMQDLDRVDPPDPGAAGVDPLLELCGRCRHDAFVDALTRGGVDGAVAPDASTTSGWLPR